MAINIEVDQEERPTEEIFLGVEGPYIFAYPKMGKIMNAHLRVKGMPKDKAETVMVETMMDWMRRGFGDAAWDHIQKRIDNDDDSLDTPHLLNAFRLLVEAHAGRPTTSSSDASAQPWMKSQADVPSAAGSVSETSTYENSAT